MIGGVELETKCQHYMAMSSGRNGDALESGLTLLEAVTDLDGQWREVGVSVHNINAEFNDVTVSESYAVLGDLFAVQKCPMEGASIRQE